MCRPYTYAPCSHEPHLVWALDDVKRAYANLTRARQSVFPSITDPCDLHMVRYGERVIWVDMRRLKSVFASAPVGPELNLGSWRITHHFRHLVDDCLATLFEDAQEPSGFLL